MSVYEQYELSVSLFYRWTGRNYASVFRARGFAPVGLVWSRIFRTLALSWGRQVSDSQGSEAAVQKRSRLWGPAPERVFARLWTRTPQYLQDIRLQALSGTRTLHNHAVDRRRAAQVNAPDFGQETLPENRLPALRRAGIYPQQAGNTQGSQAWKYSYNS